MLRIHTNIH
jgi:hypothetical protein